MLVRQVVLPASPEELWDALTEPDALAAWFGARVDWDLRPGGPARFVDHDGTVRAGVVEDVARGAHLRFRWWPVADPADAAGTRPSEVTYELEADGEGTRLTVTEQLVAQPPPAATFGDGLPGADRLPGADGLAGDGEAGGGAQACVAAPIPGRDGASAAVTAGPSGAQPTVGPGAPARWTEWDGRLLQCWASAVAAVPVGGPRG